jgi:hypothetical protein
MRGPSIQKTIAASLLLHLTLLAISLVLVNYTKNIVLPSPYTVTLVNPGARQTGPSASGVRTPESPTSESPAAVKEAPVKESKMVDKSSNNEQKRLEESMAALLAKKKIEQRVKLREVISVKSSGQAAAATPQQGGPPGGAKGSLFDSYYGKITDEIRGEWAYPDYLK